MSKQLDVCGVYALIENRKHHQFYGFPRYIGQSVTVRARTKSHEARSRSNKHSNKWLAAVIRKQPNVLWKILVVCKEENLDLYETILIREYKPTLTNHSTGGKRNDAVSANYALSPEQRKQRAIKASATVSSETRKRISEIGRCAVSPQSLALSGKRVSAYNNTPEGKQRARNNGNVIKQRSEKEWLDSLASKGLPSNFWPASAVQAKELGLKWFRGNVCIYHPEAQGKRKTSNKACVHCSNRNKKL